MAWEFYFPSLSQSARELAMGFQSIQYFRHAFATDYAHSKGRGFWPAQSWLLLALYPDWHQSENKLGLLTGNCCRTLTVARDISATARRLRYVLAPQRRPTSMRQKRASSLEVSATSSDNMIRQFVGSREASTQHWTRPRYQH